MQHPKDEVSWVRAAIVEGNSALGIELGSTRIKAALIGPTSAPIATGSHAWSNKLVDGLWTYDLDSVIEGVQHCYAELTNEVWDRYELQLSTVGAMGCSAMMHGYLAFDSAGELLVPFRTWRNTNTDAASRALTELFEHNIPHRWSVAHLYQAILDDEEHLPHLAHVTTLAGYVHWRLTGQQVLGVGDASGMFPIDAKTGHYDEALMARFEELIAERGYPWRFSEVLPTVLSAGQNAGVLTEDGARLLDPSGALLPGTPLCPPEGDAGTGMVATNSVAVGSGNVSAGTSIFAMVVLEHPLRTVHREIDVVATPAGDLVGMVHCNNGTSDLDAWVDVFGEFATALGVELDASRLFQVLFTAGLSGEPDGGGLLAYNYVSGEPIADLDEGRPLFVRSPDSRFTLANFIRTHLYATLGALRMGMDVLREEDVHPRNLFAHGGLFKTKNVGQRILAAALDTPVSVGELAGEGGPWGMALLAAYLREQGDYESLNEYLVKKVFIGNTFDTITADPSEVEGFESFMTRYRRGLSVEGLAVELLR
jgi:sugar (pentulose or hexulose) kinase